jgi:hypothetical protein
LSSRPAEIELSGCHPFWHAAGVWQEVTMRGLILLLMTGALVSPVASWAQEENPSAPGAPQTVQKNVVRPRLEDGGVNEMMESIVVPEKPQAPFTMVLETEWIRVLADGGTITSVNKRRIARDASGRVYQERWFLVPKNGNVESQMTTIQIADPKTHQLYNCFLFGAKKNLCELLNFEPSSVAVNTAEKNVAGDLPDNQGSFAHEFLGRQFISGVETLGVRDSTTYNPGVFGNDRKVTVERELWYSPQLELNLLSVRNDPRTGKQTFTARDVVLGDPDPALFGIPPGFQVVDRRAK